MNGTAPQAPTFAPSAIPANMTRLEQIHDDVLQTTATEAVQLVFRTMLGQIAQPVSAPAGGGLPAGPRTGVRVVGIAGLVGTLNGLIYLNLDLEFALRCAGHLLGLTADELREAGDDLVNDAVGELTNMTLGAFKNQLCDRGFPCQLTIPSIVRGREFVIAAIKGATHRTYHFNIGGHRLVADLLIGPAH